MNRAWLIVSFPLSLPFNFPSFGMLRTGRAKQRRGGERGRWKLQRLVVFKRDGPRHGGAFLIRNDAAG